MGHDTRAIVRNLSDYDIIELSEARIRALFRPARAYRISRGQYPPGARFPLITAASTWFIMGGAGELVTREAVTFHAGDVLELSAGQYELAVVGNSDLDLLTVVRLPEAFWAKE